MKYFTAWLIFICVMTMYVLMNLIGCVKPEDQSVITPTPTPVATPSPTPAMVSLAWGKPSWSEHMMKEIAATKLSEREPKDVKDYCRKYESMIKADRNTFWAVLAVAIAKPESNYNPATQYKESDGNMSIGLYQLSYGDRFCPTSKSKGDLTNPMVNISCAVKLMDYFVALDGVIAAGGYTAYGAPPSKGLARYWSVVRVPDRKSKHHLAEIQSKTKALNFCK